MNELRVVDDWFSKYRRGMLKQFAEWLDQSEVLKKLDSSDPIIILMLKAQSNHFMHCDLSSKIKNRIWANTLQPQINALKI